MDALGKLNEMRKIAVSVDTVGLSDGEISPFLNCDENLRELIDNSYEQFQKLKQQFSSLMKKPERDQIADLQDSFVNFYAPDAVNPYIALAAKGPWIVTSCGAVLHDSGGYGMLGFGHSPDMALQAMGGEQVMANIMTANFAQANFIERLKKELGHSRKGNYRNPFQRFMCLNSGSEAVTVAARISDLNARKMVQESSRYHGREIKVLGLRGSFHGRTDRPAQFSDSCLTKYRRLLASFEHRENYEKVEINDIKGLETAFETADLNGVFFEAMFMEPVMGEGNPGVAVEPDFYKKARELCSHYGTLLVVDSIQAGLRAHGCLSIVDYPGFEALDGPDMEAYSKALNAGQYPLSVLALKSEVASLYETGLYGNTMTTNPRALDVASAVLDNVDEGLRKNVRERGEEFLRKLARVKEEFPSLVKTVHGTGLLLAVELDGEQIKVTGAHGLEQELRRQGIGVIHGGSNALRFTPHFLITSAEIDLVVEKVRTAFALVPGVERITNMQSA